MNLIELHILQSFPVTCLNRDDVGAPKTAVFGGAQRARVSSQCWKRAIRKLATEYAPEMFGGTRTRFVVRKLVSLFAEKGEPETRARLLAETTADALGKLDNPEKGNVKTLLFFSPLEFDAVVESMLSNEDTGPLADTILDDTRPDKERDAARKDLVKIAGKAAKNMKTAVKDMADIAIFGRMVADDPSLTLEGAGLFSHALSTHGTANEIDFFSAVDDLNEESDEGAGHIGVIEFNSACYYRYVGLNLDLLEDDNHLGHLEAGELQNVTKSFLKAAMLAVPSARKNSQFGHNPPSHILALRRQGQPLSLVNAFEEPVRSSNGYLEESKKRLTGHWETLKSLYSLDAHEMTLPPNSIDDILDGMLREVV